MSHPTPPAPGPTPAAAPPAAPAATPAPANRGGKAKKIVIGVLIAAVILLALTFIAPHFSKTELSVADQIALKKAETDSDTAKADRLAKERRADEEAKIANAERQLKLDKEQDELAQKKAKDALDNAARQNLLDAKKFKREEKAKDNQALREASKSGEPEQSGEDDSGGDNSYEARLARVRSRVRASQPPRVVAVVPPTETKVVNLPPPPAETPAVELVRFHDHDGSVRLIPKTEALALGAHRLEEKVAFTGPPIPVMYSPGSGEMVNLDGRLVPKSSLSPNHVPCTPQRCAPAAPPVRYEEPAPCREEGSKTCVNSFLNNLFSGNTLVLAGGGGNRYQQPRRQQPPPQPRRRPCPYWWPGR